MTPEQWLILAAVAAIPLAVAAFITWSTVALFVSPAIRQAKALEAAIDALPAAEFEG